MSCIYRFFLMLSFIGKEVLVAFGSTFSVLVDSSCWISTCMSIHLSDLSHACSVSRELQSRDKLLYILDGNNLRHCLNKNLGFSPESRTENIHRTGLALPHVIAPFLEPMHFTTHSTHIPGRLMDC